MTKVLYCLKHTARFLMLVTGHILIFVGKVGSFLVKESESLKGQACQT